LRYWLFSTTVDNFRITFENKVWAVDSVSKKNLVSHGDRVIFYVKGTGEFKGAIEIAGEWAKVTKPIWKEEVEDNQVYWPWQVGIRWLATGRVNAKATAQRLSFIGNKNTWYVYLMGTPANFRRDISSEDYQTFVSQMQAVTSRLVRVETTAVGKTGAVSSVLFESGGPDQTHTEVQYTLIKLGKLGRCDIWIPRADRGRVFSDEKLSSLTLPEFPQLGFWGQGTPDSGRH